MIKRKQIIVNSKVQFKLILLTFLSTFFPALLTFLSLFFILQSVLVEAKIDNPLIYNSLIIVSKKVYLVLFLGFTLITCLLISWSLIFIHRLVGPMYRLDKELEKVIKGKKINKIKFRKHDSFISIAEKINIIIEKLSSQK